jgi:photosystem II stability/assembly factor-like uncharacterized protein
MLYFSKDNNLWSTDGTLANTKKTSDLKIVGKPSDDFFNIGKTQNTVFFESIYQDKRALNTIKSSPILEIKNSIALINGKDKIHFESKIDSVKVVRLEIINKGNKDLVFSKIEVVGKDFYLNGKQSSPSNQSMLIDFPQVLGSNQRVYLEIIFFPSNEGLKNGTLKLLSNDIIDPIFNIDLIGYSENIIGNSPLTPISLEKEIVFNSANNTITIDKNDFLENSSVNSLVGTFNVLNSDGNHIYEFASGENGFDNDFFLIDNNTLKTKSLFDYEIKNTFNIRVKATNTLTNQILEQNIIIAILDVVEDQQPEVCTSDYFNLTFGLNDVKFVDNQNLVAIGNHGIILKSSDAGNSWKKIRSEDYSSLNNLQFTSNSVGYAVGDKILKTEDGGESWFSLELTKVTNTFNSPRNLFFINNEVGYVFGKDGQILKTTNGGKYWKSYNHGSNQLNSAYFFNERKGFICGSSKTLIKTNDGGITWQSIGSLIGQLRFNTVFTKIYFVNELVGFITGDYGEIIKTIDGGQTWSLVSKLEYDISINDIAFLDENKGYVLTSNYLYETVNGGLIWTRIEKDDAYESLNAFDITSDGGEKWIVGHGASCCIGYNTGSVIYKHESNTTWKTISYLGLDSNGFSAVYFNDKQGLIFSQFTSGKTLDGGITWQQIYPPETNIIQVEVINGIVYLLAQNYIYKSTDFGDTWEILSESNYFRKLYFLNSQIIYTIAQERGIFKSIDGGVTWVNVSLAPSYAIDLFFINENIGFASDAEGMYKTLDGGNSWSQVMLDPEDGYQPVVYSINFFNDSLGLAGSSAGLLKTIDGGNTWTRINKDVGGIVKFIHLNSELEWYIVSYGRLLSTKDGGNNWKTEYYGEDVDDAFFTNEKAYLVGYRHFIEISTRNAPTITSPIEGNKNTLVNVKENYSVLNEIGTNYKWSVTGDNVIIYKDNKAEILWKSAGSYVVTLTPFNGCGDGKSRDISVVVNQNNTVNPVIQGDVDVLEYSLNNSYSVLLNTESRYHWFVNGHQNFSTANNTADIDWGVFGAGKIEVFETQIATGNRKKGVLNVTINPFLPPSNNFSIEIIGETCPDKNNGRIIISANETSQYVASINNINHSFSKNLTLEGLVPNIYDLCLSIPSKNFEQCYVLELPESNSLTAKTFISSGKALINIDNGTAPYNISVNGNLVLKTMSSSFSVDVEYGDIIELSTSKDCEGKLSEKIIVSKEVLAYPNPTTGNFEINIPVNLKEVRLDLYSMQSQLISTSSYEINNGKIQLDIKNMPNGVYYAKIFLDEPTTLKIIKQ